MAGGLAMERAEQYRGKVTFAVVNASIIASLGGLIFGYVGIFGQISSRDIFYDIFVSDAYKKNPRDYDYCKYSSKYGFPSYVAPLYLAGFLASVDVFGFISSYGRRKVILFSAIISLIGALGVPFPYVDIPGLIALGFGIGFGNQAILTYLSEMAPPRYRGALNMVFHLAISIGILGSNMLKDDLGEEYFSSFTYIFGLGFPIIPALCLIVGAKWYLSETPHALVEQGMVEKGREVLAKIRGTEDIDAEFQDIVEASEFSKITRRPKFHAIKNILEKRNRPQLVLAVLIPMFQNLTGIVFVFVYAPLLFQSMGDRSSGALHSAAINGTILIVATLMSMALVDKLGRRALLLSGGILMIICQIIIAIILGTNLFSQHLSKNGLSILLIVMIGIFVLAYGWSWGPLGWTIPSEIFTLETRSVGQSIAVSINLLFTYVVLQSFVPLLCAFKYGLFLFFASWIVVMTIFVYLFLPETKGVPIEETAYLWAKHWFWSKSVVQDSEALVTPKTPTPDQVV